MLAFSILAKARSIEANMTFLLMMTTTMDPYH